MSTHERIDRHEEVVGSSDRSFGFVFAGVFSILTLLKLWRGWTDWGYLWLGLAGVFGVAAAAAPSVPAPLNRIWLKIALAIHKVIAPLIRGLLFVLVVTPTGLFRPATRKDLLRLKRSGAEKSYWIDRTPPGPAPDSMKNQF